MWSGGRGLGWRPRRFGGGEMKGPAAGIVAVMMFAGCAGAPTQAASPAAPAAAVLTGPCRPDVSMADTAGALPVAPMRIHFAASGFQPHFGAVFGQIVI